MDNISELLIQYANDPTNANKNFQLAKSYDIIGQTASALSFYIRAAERTEDKLLEYESIIRAALCCEKQEKRRFTVKSLLQRAITVLPRRPEAYYLLSKIHEKIDASGHWFESHLIACQALEFCDFNCEIIPDLDYRGKIYLEVQEANSAWYCGINDYSRSKLLDFYHNRELPNDLKDMIYHRLIKTGAYKFKEYDRSLHNRLKFKFDLSDKIEKNYSEAYQDMFVLSMLNGKKNGTYVEIGGGPPFYGNNTALLETAYSWTGVSVENNTEYVKKYSKERKNICVCRDALGIDYDKFLAGQDFEKEIDYLQIDLDPFELSYKVLLMIPFERYKFAVITFEHDYYHDDSKSYRDKARKYLKQYGYELVVGNLSPDEYRPYEDWWVHPDLVDQQIINQFKTQEDIVSVEKLFLENK